MRRWARLACLLLLVSPSVGAQGLTEEEYREQLEAQRQEIARLQQQLANRQVERERLTQMLTELDRIRAQIAAGQAAAAAQEAAHAQQLRNFATAVDLLRDADGRLATGSTDVVDTLDEAAGLLVGQPRDYVEGAIAALDQSDTSAARFSIAAAISALGGY